MNKFGALILLSILATASCAEKKPPRPQGPTGPPDAVAIETSNATATVTEIDSANRKVTIREQDGSQHTYKCGKDVANFDRFRVGDQVSATVANEIAVYLRKPGEEPRPELQTSVTNSARNEKPGITVTEAVETTARIGAIDSKQQTVTLDDLGSKTTTIHVEPRANLGALHIGDDVIVKCTKTMAIMIENPPDK